MTIEADRWLVTTRLPVPPMHGELVAAWYRSGIPRLVDFLASPAAFPPETPTMDDTADSEA